MRFGSRAGHVGVGVVDAVVDAEAGVVGAVRCA